jgi:predicted  nucleic acid-binding Zn-ribbon protein
VSTPSPTAPPEVQARLLDLAALDAELARVAAHRRRLEQDDAMSKAVADRSAARRNVADRRDALEDARRELGRLEGDVGLVEQRLTRDRGRLAATSSAKDAQGLESEIASLLHRRSVLEDEELEVMGRVEDGEGALATAEEALAAADARISALQLDRDDALAGLAEQEARAAEQRSTLVAELPADLVALYERQRARYGIGAAPLRGTVSGGSNMALTGADLALVRAAPPDAVVLDPESGCILVRLPEGKA